MLNKLETESDKITLDLLATECQRTINLKLDTEKSKSEAIVKQIHTNTHKKTKQGPK